MSPQANGGGAYLSPAKTRWEEGADGTPLWSLSITYRHFPARVETQAEEVVYQR